MRWQTRFVNSKENKLSILSQAKPAGELSKTDGVKILVYGNAGTGKTSMCATTGCPDQTLILSAESGLLSIADSGIPAITVKTIQTLREVHRELAAGNHPYKWVCLDSISEIAEVCLAAEAEKTRNKIQAYGEMGTIMTSLVKAFRDLPMNVYMSCKLTQSEDDGVLVRQPSTPGKKLAEALPYLFDEVFALVAGKGKDDTINRLLITGARADYIAKDRSGKLDQYEHPNLADIYNKIYGAPTDDQ